MVAAKRKHELTKALQQMNEEGQGVWRLLIITRADVPSLIAAAGLGNELACRLYTGLSAAVEQMPQQRGLCLLCDYEFSPDKMPDAFVLLSAMRDDTQQCLANAL